MKFVKATVLWLFCATALAAESINEITDAAADGTVIISNTAGSVTVRGWSRNQVEVTGTLGSGVEELEFERDGNEVVIKVKMQRRSSSGSGTRLVVNVPERSSLKVNTVSADIEVSDVSGEQQLETVSGDVETESAGSDVVAGSVSGDVDVQGLGRTARANLHTVSGDVSADNLAGEIRAESVSGEITIVNGSFSRVSANTVNGRIVLQTSLTNDGRVDIETVNGSVDVEFAGEVSARFDIETFNGAIRNCFGPEAVRTSKYTPGRELRFTEGGGTGRVTIETLNGSVRVCK